MKNLKETAERLKKASTLEERVIIYGDSDLDGVVSVIILKKTLEKLGIKPDCFFVDRERRDHGLSPESVEIFKEKSPAIIVTLDCGISNFRGIEKAKKEGFEVIVVDHHTPLDTLPEASLVVCPKQEEGVFEEFSNGGLTLLLAEEILNEEVSEFYELAALSIFSDMMKREGDNLEILKKSSNCYPQTVALKALEEILEISDFENLFQETAKILNISKIIEGVPESFSLLLLEDLEKAKEKAYLLIEKQKERIKKTKEIEKEIEEIFEGGEIIFLGKKKWPTYLLGKVASRVLNKYKRPVFLYKEGEKRSRGTVRTPSSCNAVKAMESCQDILEEFGGHPPAAGFSIKNENLEEFKERLIKYFSDE